MKPAEALRAFGPQFGVLWYRRGICEMKLQRWDAAIRSFETCYRDYPNRGPSGGNLYQTKALLKWGESAVGAKQWEVAVSRFRKFLDERDKTRDKFQQGAFYITLGICHYRLGHIPEGNEQLEIAIRNQASFPTSEDQMVAGVQALVAAAIHEKNEAALVDFLANNRTGLVFPPYRAQAYAGVYLKLASDVETAGMPRAALSLYPLVVDPEAAILDLKARLALPDGDKPALEAALKRLEENSRSETPIRLLKLAGMATAQEAAGDSKAACGLREQIATEFASSPMAKENLQQLVRMRNGLASALEREGKTDEAISAYEKVWMEGQESPGMALRAAKRWMELLWERNRGDDRVTACRGGLSLLESTREQEIELADEDLEARDEVARLTKTFQANLAAKVTPPP